MPPFYDDYCPLTYLYFCVIKICIMTTFRFNYTKLQICQKTLHLRNKKRQAESYCLVIPLVSGSQCHRHFLMFSLVNCISRN